MSHEELKYSNIFEAITEDKGEAAVLKFRADLMLVMKQLIEHKQLSQSDIMLALGISQEQTADLINCKIGSFSSDQLIAYLAILGF